MDPHASLPLPRWSLALASLPLLGLLAGADPALAQPEPARIYAQSCAGCHGDDGRGQAQERVGFDLPLPDFSDCSFATREPDGDWGVVVHEGGPSRGFDPMMPAFGAALSPEEIQAALDHVRTFCGSKAWPRGDLNFPRALLTEKAYPEDELVLTSALPFETPVGVASKLIYETRIGPMGQLEAIVPFSFDGLEGGGWSGGLGDVALGTKWVLLSSNRSGSIFSAAAEVKLPTGRPDLGYGKGITIFEPFLSFGQALPLDGFFQLMAGGEISTDPDVAAHELFARGVVGLTFTQGLAGRAWTPMLELVTARELESGATLHWDLVPQVQFTLNQRQHLMAAVGVRIPGDRFGDEPPQLLIYLLWDWFDGGLTEGW